LSLTYDCSRELYLVFHDDTAYFGSRFIKKGFKHVFIIERQAMGWICLDPSRSDLIASILPAQYESDVISELKNNNPDVTVLPLEVLATNRSNYPRPGIQSCVGAVQYSLGVWWPFVLTPWRLYNKLIKSPPIHIRKLESCQEIHEQEEKPQQHQQEQMSYHSD
jgi:hypothetical protein